MNTKDNKQNNKVRSSQYDPDFGRRFVTGRGKNQIDRKQYEALEKIVVRQ